MSDKPSTRFKTQPIMLTRVTLYEAKSFKPTVVFPDPATNKVVR